MRDNSNDNASTPFERLLQRWFGGLLLGAIQLLIYTGLVQSLSRHILPKEEIISIDGAFTFGLLGMLFVFGVFEQLYATQLKLKQRRALRSKRTKLRDQCLDLAQKILVNVGMGEDWIAYRLREIEKMEAEPDLARYLHWRRLALIVPAFTLFLVDTVAWWLT